MNYSIRRANQTDVSQLEKHLGAYMRETYKAVWGGNGQRLEQDLSDGVFKMFVVADKSEKLIGFVAWTDAYDLHWCLKGGEIIDFYIAPENRGRGIGLLLAIELAAKIKADGGVFLKGGAVENDSVRRFYSRVAMSFPNGECYVSGRAFRHLAGLTGKNLREIIRNLPENEWNHQP